MSGDVMTAAGFEVDKRLGLGEYFVTMREGIITPPSEVPFVMTNNVTSCTGIGLVASYLSQIKLLGLYHSRSEHADAGKKHSKINKFMESYYQ